MTKAEKTLWFFLAGLRSTLAFLDLAGVLIIGYLATSSVAFLTSGSDPERGFEFAGFKLPAVSMDTLPLVAGAVLALFLLKGIFSILLTRKSAFFVAKIEARASKVITQIRLGGNLTQARKQSREEVMAAVHGGTSAAFNLLLNGANTFITEAALFLVICIGFFFIDPVVTLAALVYFGLMAFAVQLFVGSLMNRAEEVKYQSAVRSTTAISDLIAVFRELVVLGKREKYVSRVFEARKENANSGAITFYLSGMPRYIIEAALLVGVALFILSQSYSGDLASSAGKVGIFLAGGFRLTAALLPLQASLLTMKSAVPAARMAHEVLLAHKEVESQSQEQNPDPQIEKSSPKPLGVTFKNVGFTYPEKSSPALHNLNFTIEAGSQTALIGPSGSGKSTIADLLCLIIHPTSGLILRTYGSGEPTGLGGRVSYVPQKPGIVSGTILDNVALGVDYEQVDREAVEEALRISHLGELLETLPEGIDTALGKLMDNLSGGQMQRIGLARALYFKPSLLVMDEATSALDAESEAEIQAALEEMRGKVTVVIIAHRLNTIQHADKVILIQEGAVQDSGSFKELIARNPIVEKGVELMKIDRD
jgi:ABC-type multidrug transport system fused ATPase/permease subunit